jgi:hypothetical protein
MRTTIVEYLVAMLLALAWGIVYSGSHANNQPDPIWEQQRPNPRA